MGAPDPIADEPPAPTQTAVVEFRCDNCGAPVKAEPGADALKCEHCGHTQPIQRKEGRIVEYDFQAALRDAPRGSASDLATGAREVSCKGCGARTVTSSQSGACPFCGSPLIADLKAGDKLMLPESLLPHRVTRDEAKTAFQRWLKSRWFAPNDLVRRSKAAGLDGVMLPHWTYDSHTTTSYTGLRGDHYYVTVSYTDSKGNSRTRTERRTRWRPAAGTVYVPFDDVLVCASRSLPEKLVRDLEPWDLGALQPFDPAYLAGYVTERYTIDLEGGFDLAEERMKPRIRREIERDIGGDVQQIFSMDVTHRDVKFKHLLLPLWISSFRYRERVFRVVVNARTGEVQGERPWSWIKITLLVLFLAALVGAGVWLYLRSQAATDDDTGAGTDEYEPYTPPPSSVPTPEPPPPPPRVPIMEPLEQLDNVRAAARKELRDAALTGIEIRAVGLDGGALDAAVFSFRSASAARKQRPCTIDVTLGPSGFEAAAPAEGACAAPIVAAPTCTLPAIFARVPDSAARQRGELPSFSYRARPSVEAQPGRDPALAGQWTVTYSSQSFAFDDDCAPPPAPRPARPRRPR